MIGWDNGKKKHKYCRNILLLVEGRLTQFIRHSTLVEPRNQRQEKTVLLIIVQHFTVKAFHPKRATVSFFCGNYGTTL